MAYYFYPSFKRKKASTWLAYSERAHSNLDYTKTKAFQHYDKSKSNGTRHERKYHNCHSMIFWVHCILRKTIYSNYSFPIPTKAAPKMVTK